MKNDNENVLTGYPSKDMPWKKYYEREFSLSDIPDE